MKTLFFIFVLLTISYVCYAQEDQEFFIVSNENGQYLVRGDSYLIDPTSECGDFIEEITVERGKKYDIIHLFDEMLNRRGVIILDKTGKQIDITPVQNEREKYYEFYGCCIYVKELKGDLYFWDVIEPFELKKDYDCYYDSQTDASKYLIPRYYIFNPEKGSVKTVILNNECFELFKEGKINCR